MHHISFEYLSKLNFYDVCNKNYLKGLLVINYYVLKNFDLLNEQLEFYKKFLSNNNSLPDSYKQKSVIFDDYMFKLFKTASGRKTDLRLLK